MRVQIQIDHVRKIANYSACKNGSSVNFRPNNNAPIHPNGTFIKTSSNSAIYLIRNNQKQLIASPTILRNLYAGGGFDFKDVITVAQDEFDRYTTGSPITSPLTSNGRTHSEGRLIRRATGGEVSIVTDNGMRRSFVSEAGLLGLGYLWCNVIDATDANYDSYPIGSPITGEQATGCPSASTIAVGQTRNGNLQSGDCLKDGKFYDAYTFSGTAGQQLYITLSAPFDAYLYLCRGNYPGGTLVAENDDSGGIRDSRIPINSGFLTLSATGTYTILASSYYANDTGSYTLFLGAGGQSCVYSISSASQSFTSNGGSGTVNVSTNSGCNWTATSNTTWISVNSGVSGYGSGTVSYSVASNSSQARTGTITFTGQTFTVTQSGGTSSCSSQSVIFDQTLSGSLQSGDCLINGRYYVAYTFNGTAQQRISIRLNSADLDSYLYLYRGNYPGGTQWSYNDDGGGYPNARIPATSGFITLPATGIYTISTAGFGAVQFGISTDKPVVGDYDGDGKADEAVYRPSEGVWHLLRSSQSYTGIQFGILTDLPAPGDYDGDGKTDIAVWRPNGGVFYVLGSIGNQFSSYQFGSNGDLPVASAFVP